MKSVAGIFIRRIGALSAIDRLQALGVDRERLILLSPGTPDEDVEQTVPINTEGTAEKIGFSVGRGAGILGGILLGGAVGSVFVPASKKQHEQRGPSYSNNSINEWRLRRPGREIMKSIERGRESFVHLRASWRRSD